jgi:hypothetical protein
MRHHSAAFTLDAYGQFADALRAAAQAAQDPHAARGRQRLHGVGDRGREASVEAVGAMQLTVAHATARAAHTFICAYWPP